MNKSENKTVILNINAEAIADTIISTLIEKPETFAIAANTEDGTAQLTIDTLLIREAVMDALKAPGVFEVSQRMKKPEANADTPEREINRKAIAKAIFRALEGKPKFYYDKDGEIINFPGYYAVWDAVMESTNLPGFADRRSGQQPE